MTTSSSISVKSDVRARERSGQLWVLSSFRVLSGSDPPHFRRRRKKWTGSLRAGGEGTRPLGECDWFGRQPWSRKTWRSEKLTRDARGALSQEDPIQLPRVKQESWRGHRIKHRGRNCRTGFSSAGVGLGRFISVEVKNPRIVLGRGHRIVASFEILVQKPESVSINDWGDGRAQFKPTQGPVGVAEDIVNGALDLKPNRVVLGFVVELELNAR